MSGWFETGGVILAAVMGAGGGRAFSRLKNPHWGWGYFLPSAVIVFLLVATYTGLSSFVPAIVWFSGGRARFVIIAVAVAMGSMTLVGRLKNPVEKAVVLILMIGVVIWSAVLPFLVPTLIKNDLMNLKTRLDDNNICVQTTNYTCGPAAAVTALRQLGLPAQEGELAVLSHSGPFVGTLPWSLYKAIQDRYGPQGLDCRFRHFDSVSQLREADVTLAVVKDAFLVDHCVAVIEVGNDTVTIADPVLGRLTMSYKDFEGIWRFYGIALKSAFSQKG